MAAEGRLPDTLVACIGGGQMLLAYFHPFLDDEVKIIGVEALDMGSKQVYILHLKGGRPGILHGNRTYLYRMRMDKSPKPIRSQLD